MTEKQKEELLRLKAQGFSKEQAIARVFTSKAPTSQEDGYFSGAKDRLAEVGFSTADAIKEGTSGSGSFLGDVKGGVQATAAGFLATPRGAFAMIPDFAREPVEEVGEKVGEGIGKGIDWYSDTKAIKELSLRTKEGGATEQGLGILAGLGDIAGTTAATGGTVGTLTTTANFVTRQAAKLTPGAKPPVAIRQTPEKIFSEVETDLQRISKDPNLTPAERSAAAQASLTYRERLAGVTPDEKKRIQEMAPGTLERYLDQAHMRNVDDTVDAPYTLGAKRADEALEGLNARLNETGGIIGDTRKKLATYQLAVDDIKGNIDRKIVGVEGAFLRELAKLNLSIRNGQIGVTPGKIAKTASNSDISTLQSLYNDVLTFKQSPTVANAIDLRMKFDGKINFDKSSREASNSVDPLSKSVRAELAKGAARVVGKTQARELARYSDFMEAYADLKSYTDRAAGGEYLLRLVLSGRGGEAKKLINTVKSYTGIDLMDDALAMKLATDIIGNEGQKNLFRQEVTKAGLDAARIFSGDVKGFTEAVAQKLIDKGVNPEDVYRAIAAGTAGYLLVAYTDEEGLTGAGIAMMGAMSPQARKQALKQADEIAKSTGKTLKLADGEKDVVLNSLMKSDSMTPASKTGAVGQQTVDMEDFAELERLKALAEKPKGLTDSEYIEARAILEKYQPDSFKQSATTKTTLLEEAKGKSLDEFVKGQGTPVYHGTNQDFDVFGEGQGELSATKMGSAKKGIFFTDSLDEAGAYGRNADKMLVANENAFNKKYEDMMSAYEKAEMKARRSGDNADWDVATKLQEEAEAFYYDGIRSTESNARVITSYLDVKNPLIHNADGQITSGKVQELIKQAKKEGKDGVILKNVSDNPEGTKDFRSNHTIVFSPDQIKTRSQLEDIWKQANGKGTTLLEEAKGKTGTILNDTTDIGASVEYRGDTYIYTRQRGVNGDQAVLKNADGQEISVPKSDVTKSRSQVKQNVYGMQHRPSESGSGFDITDSEAMPKDFYDNPQQYIFGNEEASQESIKAILKIHNKPNADVVVYRATPKNELNDGDWISLSKKYAEGESLAEGVKVHNFTVKAKDIQFAGDDINEFGYFPKD